MHEQFPLCFIVSLMIFYYTTAAKSGACLMNLKNVFFYKIRFITFYNNPTGLNMGKTLFCWVATSSTETLLESSSKSGFLTVAGKLVLLQLTGLIFQNTLGYCSFKDSMIIIFFQIMVEPEIKPQSKNQLVLFFSFFLLRAWNNVHLEVY